MVLAKYAGCILAEELGKHLVLSTVDLITAVPSSRPSFRRRLFNPAAVLAERIAAAASLPFRPGALVHKGYRSPQARQSHARRLTNVKDSFGACAQVVRGSRVLLVDDVVTTGATLAAAAKALLDAGAGSVDTATLSYSEQWLSFLHRVAETCR